MSESNESIAPREIPFVQSRTSFECAPLFLNERSRLLRLECVLMLMFSHPS
jgi:hypothetical protein